MQPDTNMVCCMFLLLSLKQRPQFRNSLETHKHEWDSVSPVSEIWPWYEHTLTLILCWRCVDYSCAPHVVRLWAVCVVSRHTRVKHNSLTHTSERLSASLTRWNENQRELTAS